MAEAYHDAMMRRLSTIGQMGADQTAYAAQQATQPVQQPTYASSSSYSSGGTVSGDAHSRLLALGKKLQSMGYQVGENPAFGGVAPVHVKNSNHYSGNAIDVNWGNSAQEVAKINAILPLIKAYGLGDIWQQPGHYDHAHISTNGR
jgi:hypothetical protein